MKIKNQSILLFLAFFLIGITPTFAEDLLSGSDPWPTIQQQKEYRPRLRNEERGGIAFGAIGYIAGRIIGKEFAVPGAVVGAMAGSHMGARSEAEALRAEARAHEGQLYCRKLYAEKTDEETGGNYAQHSKKCVGDGYENDPIQPIVAPSKAVYGKPRVDPRAGLSDRDRKALEERDAAERGMVLSDDERKVIEGLRRQQAAPAPAPNASSPAPASYMAQVSYKPVCRPYGTNANCAN